MRHVMSLFLSLQGSRVKTHVYYSGGLGKRLVQAAPFLSNCGIPITPYRRDPACLGADQSSAFV